MEPHAVQTTTAPTAPEVNNSTRGNILKALRQPAEITNIEGKHVANFTINSITPDTPCTGPYPEPAKNSHITVLDVTVQTMPDTSTSPSTFDICSSAQDGHPTIESPAHLLSPTPPSKSATPDPEAHSISCFPPAERSPYGDEYIQSNVDPCGLILLA